MAWALKGLREGIVTSRYPRRADDYGPGFKAAVDVLRPPGGATSGDGTPPAHGVGPSLTALCPTGAITQGSHGVVLDRGLCIQCGRCVAQRPDLFAFQPSPELAVVHRAGLVVPRSPETDQELERVRRELQARVRSLRRSVHVRHLDAGSDGAEEWEVAALLNPVYDIQRLGVFFTASPRHADLLLVTGAGSDAMAEPLRTAYEAMPEPKVVLAAGTDAISGGLFQSSYATHGGVTSIVPVDVFVPGSPPSAFSLLHGILMATGLLPGSAVA